MSKSMLIVDGSYFLFRSYAVPFKFSSKIKGIPLHVLTTYLKFLRLVIKVLEKDHEINKIVVIFDSQKDNERLSLDSNYKSNRKKDYSLDADSPFHHYPLIRQLLNYAGIANYEARRGEADDLIASLAEKYKSGFEIYIASNDSDFYQLLSESIKIVRLKAKNNIQIASEESFVDELGIRPSQYVSWKSLVGDRADNIAGIKGIGPKKATAFLNGSLKLDISQHRQTVQLNKKLITMDRKLPIGWIKHSLSYNQRIMSSNKDLFEAVGYT